MRLEAHMKTLTLAFYHVFGLHPKASLAIQCKSFSRLPVVLKISKSERGMEK